MTNRDMLRENMAASRDHVFSLRDQKLLEEYRLATAHLYCHGCGHHCEPAAGGVAVADILRYLRYHEVYGKRQRAARAVPGPLPRSPQPCRRRSGRSPGRLPARPARSSSCFIGPNAKWAERAGRDRLIVACSLRVPQISSTALLSPRRRIRS